VLDWVTTSSLATAAGTLVLAVATFASVRSGNRTARLAERSLLAGLRPVLVPTRIQDPAEKIGFVDNHWIRAEGGRGVAEVSDTVIYLGIPVRNVGSGLGVLHGWSVRIDEIRQRAALEPGARLGEIAHLAPEAFRRLTRDLYIPSGDQGMWQGALRDPTEPIFATIRDAINAREPLAIELLYGDAEGGQRTISRFSLVPRGEEGEWVAAVSRHWNLDRPDPR
jgi:hypothetical protein